MKTTINYNELISFMKEFEIDLLNRYNELIIDETTNTYVSINGCHSIEDVKTRVVYALCRPIGKGLELYDSKRLLKRLNKYFQTDLTREDMRLMYQKLCYATKIEEFKQFIQQGFPVKELEKVKTV